MSLLKARNMEIKCKGYGELERDFLEVIDTANGEYTTDDLIALIQIYCMYSVEYLIDVATSLVKPEHADNAMKYMNSYIAEITNVTENKYFHKEEGYSIIDKSIQIALDNEGVVGYDEVSKLVEDINLSFIEVEIDEE